MRGCSWGTVGGRKTVMHAVAQRLLGLALGLIAGLGLAYLLISNALDKGISTLERLVALVIGLVTLVVLWRLEFPKGVSRNAWQKPVDRAHLMNVGLGVFGVLSTVVAMMAPRPSVESKPGIIEGLVRSIAGNVDQIRTQQNAIGQELGVGSSSLIRQKIDGTWGEPNCSVVRRFDLRDRALDVSTVRVPAGMKPLHWTFTIEAEANETSPAGMRASTFSATEHEGLFPGSSVKFRYLTDGETERLVWNSENDNQASPELVRCP